MRMLDRTLRVCSLFAGCGGLDLGMAGGFEFLGTQYPHTGLKTVWAADNDPDAITTLRSNTKYFGWPDALDAKQIDLTEFMDYDSLPPFEILAAGFPCQPFSNAGDRGGINDKHGRGTLFEVCERLVNTLPQSNRPLAYVFENVKGILSTRMPNGKSVPQEIVSRMETLGYDCAGPFLAKAENYGVPQQRHRVIMVGLRKDLGKRFDYGIMKNYIISASLNHLKLRDVISNVDNLPDAKEIWHLSPQARYMVSMIHRSWKDVPYEKLPERFKRIRDNMERYRAPNFYRRFSFDEINGTITASAQPENCGIIHPVENRRFSVREIARIQSFPDDFVFAAKTVPAKYRLVGNAVPPILGYVIGCAIRDTIMEVANGAVFSSTGGEMVRQST